MKAEEALHQFWTSFGLTAYEENSVPTGNDAPQFPYITYSVVTDAFGGEVALSGSVWTRSTSWLSAASIAKSIFDSISMGGKSVKYDNGVIWIKRGQPFSQSMGDPSDDLIKRKYINITAEFLTAE